MSNTKTQAKSWKLGPRQLASIDRYHDPIFFGNFWHPDIVVSSRRKPIKQVHDSDLVSVEPNQPAQRYSEGFPHTLVEKEFRRFAHAAMASES